MLTYNIDTCETKLNKQIITAVNFNQMTEQEQKHWFELGKKVERNKRTYFTSKEFWFGIILGMLTMYSLIAFGVF